ncbi:MAG TPA: 16S rRNA (cytosine(1402)-N(4))-methyltransferase RsmH [Dissulfurispiraceae bacterium]|nr:16S rRNA (cytosine(1402)-N(4))-methyltransferase RsmH [Dissulfurispiraceae bacterium]
MEFNSRAAHTPVLLNEVIGMLEVRENGVYVDATVGLGGHASAILKRIGRDGELIGIDRDEEALSHAAERLGNGRVHLNKGSFSEIGEIVSGLGKQKVDGVLFDLGVSMLQLKEHDRGFSFMSDSRLDMRMDPSQKLSAWEVVNRYQEKDLQLILKEFGEEPLFRKIAKRIATARQSAPINTCAELAELVLQAYGGRGRTHPATRTFQALRIEVNKELEELRAGLSTALGILKIGGRMCVIAYHSLEDRIVKNTFRDLSRAGDVRLLTKKPVVPAREEVLSNPASRSAKLRGIEKI